MAYNKAAEEKKWKKWKHEEEKIMRQYGVPEFIISELRKFDWALFNSERRFLQRQFTNNEQIDYLESYEINVPVHDINTLLEFHITNEKLFLLLNTLDEKTLKIIFYKFCGYSNRSIAKLMFLSESAISKRIAMVRSEIKKL